MRSLHQQRPSNTGRFCHLLIQVFIVEFQQEPGTVEIEFTAVTSSPGQAAVCRVRVEVKNQVMDHGFLLLEMTLNLLFRAKLFVFLANMEIR